MSELPARPRRLVTRLALGLLCTVLTLGGSAGATAQTQPDDVVALEQAIDDVVDGHVGDTVPGVMVAVVGADGPLLLEARGVADPATGMPLTVDSRTPVASVSKVVTALAALTLHHEGVLDLDTDVRADLPLRDERDARLRGPVTGRHLLTHHSGISESALFHPDPPAEERTVPLLSVLEDNPPVLRAPAGTGLHYSPLQAYTMLGAAMEQATGETFDDIVARRVLDPAGATTADFLGPSDQPGDVVLSTRDGDGWTASVWPWVDERPAASLTWSARDAAALLHTLLDPAQDALPAAVVEEATRVAVRPPHGGGGHTQVFFEAWREDVRVLEHAGANGLAWLALIPEADIGVFAAVTTEDADAADLASDVLDAVAAWSARTGRASAAPPPPEGMPTVTLAGSAAAEPAEPVGTFHEQLFGARGPELPLRTLIGQVAVSRDGDTLRMNERTLRPVSVPGRWCDAEGCIAGVAADDGTVVLLRGDRAMLEQTLVPAPWWADQRVVLAAAAGTVLLAAVALVGAVRAWWRPRRERPVPAAVSRPAGLGWTLGAVALLVLTPLLPLSPFITGSTDWIPADGAAVWGLRVLTAGVLLLGGAWVFRAVTRWQELSTARRVAVIPAAAVGLAMSAVLVTWALPVL